MRLLIQFLSAIPDNHHRFPNFFTKYEQIILFFKYEIKQKLSNFEIFQLFQKNKKVLLFLIQKQILILSETIVNYLTQEKFTKLFYLLHLWPDVISNLDAHSNSVCANYEKVLTQKMYSENLNEKRLEGENELYICELIRNDSIDDFILYASKNQFVTSFKN